MPTNTSSLLLLLLTCSVASPSTSQESLFSGLISESSAKAHQRTRGISPIHALGSAACTSIQKLQSRYHVNAAECFQCFQCFQESLFSGLIPESSAKALSKYTEMVDVTTRELLDKLANATDNARIRLMVREMKRNGRGGKGRGKEGSERE